MALWDFGVTAKSLGYLLHSFVPFFMVFVVWWGTSWYMSKSKVTRIAGSSLPCRTLHYNGMCDVTSPGRSFNLVDLIISTSLFPTIGCWDLKWNVDRVLQNSYVTTSEPVSSQDLGHWLQFIVLLLRFNRNVRRKSAKKNFKHSLAKPTYQNSTLIMKYWCAFKCIRDLKLLHVWIYWTNK